MKSIYKFLGLDGVFWFKDLLLPIFVTMIGVYLGLLVNDWQESRKDNQLTAQMVGIIRQEVRDNHLSLQKSSAYHRLLHDSLAHWRQMNLRKRF